MPVLEVVLVDVTLHFAHLAFIGQDDHHGGVVLVGQHNDSGVVVSILIEIVATCPLHHVHLNRGGVIYMEVCLGGHVLIEGFLPLS